MVVEHCYTCAPLTIPAAIQIALPVSISVIFPSRERPIILVEKRLLDPPPPKSLDLTSPRAEKSALLSRFRSSHVQIPCCGAHSLRAAHLFWSSNFRLRRRHDRFRWPRRCSARWRRIRASRRRSAMSALRPASRSRPALCRIPSFPSNSTTRSAPDLQGTAVGRDKPAAQPARRTRRQARGATGGRRSRYRHGGLAAARNPAGGAVRNRHRLYHRGQRAAADRNLRRADFEPRSAYSAVAKARPGGCFLSGGDLRAQVAADLFRVDRERAKTQLATARRDLAILMGDSSPKFGEAVGRLASIGQPPSFQSVIQAIEANPQLMRWTA